MEQRSAEWYKIRAGKVTASNVSSILGNLNHKKCQDSIDNMALEKAIESVHGMLESDFVSYDMQRGIDMEPSAFKALQHILAKDFVTLSKVGFAEISEHSGASPDGLASDGSNCEIKCPTAKNFFKLKITNEILPSYYAQMQKQMLCTNAKKTYFFNYCIHLGVEHSHLIIVERDEEMISTILEREAIVIAKKLDYIKKLTNAI